MNRFWASVFMGVLTNELKPDGQRVKPLEAALMGALGHLQNSSGNIEMPAGVEYNKPEVQMRVTE